MPILTDIEAAMKSLIQNMAVSGDYNYNWGTVNEDDMALCVFPCAEIILTEDTSLDDPEGAWYQAYNNEATFNIVIRGKLDSVEKNPNYSINTVHNKALDDLKKLFGTVYHLSDTCDRIMYVSMNREIKKNGDVFMPGEMTTVWNVRYTQDRLSPETPAS